MKNKIMQVFAFNTFIFALVLAQATFADGNYRVKSSDNLISIAEKQYEGSGLTQSQILVGIYASNPKSFKNGNINKLLRGQELVLPDADKIDRISHGEAELVLSARKKGKKKKSKKRVKSKRKTKSRKKVVKKRKSKLVAQKQNIKKIKKLESEGESLKLRLEKLMAEKTASDNKLKELEGSLQKALKKTAVIATVATVGVDTKPKKDTASESELVTQRANEKLREKNALLEKKLQESNKEIASNTRASLAIKEPQKPVINKAVDADNSKSSKAEQAVKTPEKNKIQSPSEAAVSTFELSNKYLQWALLSLLLFPLIWFAKRFITSKRVKEQPAWVTENEELGGLLGGSSSEIVDTHYQEAPLESSIKLDVASAYLESGDTDEAIQILNEIVAEGNDEQVAEAQAILEGLY